MNSLKTLKEINNLRPNKYKNLWIMFWEEKLGFNPFESKMKFGKITNSADAKTEDEELENEFIAFYLKQKKNLV
jgi:hypothetical protein